MAQAFIRVKCNGYHHEHLVAFSCKRRGFFHHAGHAVDHVIPVAVRQWVLSFPWPLPSSLPIYHGWGGGKDNSRRTSKRVSHSGFVLYSGQLAMLCLLRRRDCGIKQSGLLAASALTEKSTHESLDQCGADPGRQTDTGIEEDTQIYRHVVWPHSGLLQSLLPGHQLR